MGEGALRQSHRDLTRSTAPEVIQRITFLRGTDETSLVWRPAYIRHEHNAAPSHFPALQLPSHKSPKHGRYSLALVVGCYVVPVCSLCRIANLKYNQNGFVLITCDGFFSVAMTTTRGACVRYTFRVRKDSDMFLLRNARPTFEDLTFLPGYPASFVRPCAWAGVESRDRLSN